MGAAGATTKSTRIQEVEAYLRHVRLVCPSDAACLFPLPSSALSPPSATFSGGGDGIAVAANRAFRLSVTTVWEARLTDGLPLSNFPENIRDCSKTLMIWQSDFTSVCCSVGFRSANVQDHGIIRFEG